MPPLNRREAIKAGTALVGAAVFASSGVLAACGGSDERAAGDAKAAPTGVLSRDDQALMEEVADTLLPDTPASPGAKAAGAGAAIQLLLTDCYDAAAQQRVVRGLAELRAACRARRNAEFASLPRPDRERLLRELDAAAKQAGPTHWFPLVREVAERAYWSSETGMTKALRWVQNPGHFTGCMPLAPNQPAWG